MKRLVCSLLLVAGVTWVWAEGHGGRMTWIQYDSATKTNMFSTGGIAPASLTPGQYVSGRGGTWRARGEWRPPQDVIVKFPPTNGMTRVDFSHERHFGALGSKNCKVCHLQLGSDKPLRSFATTPVLEPHGEKSIGRFCETCHHDKFTTGQIDGAKLPTNITIFTALGSKGDKSCEHCHAPADHGADFTGHHGDRAEHGASKQCSVCHRGAGSISSTDHAQARAYREAQLALVKNSEDTLAFQKVLPNNFCSYCHGASRKGHEED